MAFALAGQHAMLKAVTPKCPLFAAGTASRHHNSGRCARHAPFRDARSSNASGLPARFLVPKIAAIEEQPTDARAPIDDNEEDNTTDEEVLRQIAASDAETEAQFQSIVDIQRAPSQALLELLPTIATAKPEISTRDREVEELDQAQEELIKWATLLTDEEQEKDLNDIVDYEDIDDDEYEQIFSEKEIEELHETAEKFAEVIEAGEIVQGVVQTVDDEGAYVELPTSQWGYIPLEQCSLAKLKSALEVLRPGMRRDFFVYEDDDEGEGEVLLSLAALEVTTFWNRMRQLQEEDWTVFVTVTSVNRGGLLVKYHHLEGFVPLSHFGAGLPSGRPLLGNELEDADEGASDLGVDEETSFDDLIGKQIPVKFLEVNEEEDRLVFSNRRASADAESQAYKIGDVVLGTVQSVKPYGAFIDIGGGATGLLHISQISQDRVTTVETVLQEGDQIKVLILSQDRDRGRVTLSTKKLEPSPGDMLRNPKLVFEKAEEMAAQFRERVEAAEQTAAYADANFTDNYYPAGYMDTSFQTDATLNYADPASFAAPAQYDPVASPEAPGYTPEAGPYAPDVQP